MSGNYMTGLVVLIYFAWAQYSSHCNFGSKDRVCEAPHPAGSLGLIKAHLRVYTYAYVLHHPIELHVLHVARI